MAIDEGKLNELLGQFVTDLGGAFHAVSAVIGDRLGLYRALQATMPATPAEVASAAGAGERYVREWLSGQAAGGYVSYDPRADRFHLTEEQEFALAWPDGMQTAAAFHIPVAVARNVDAVTEAIRTGRGFGWHEHDTSLYEGTERFFRPGYVANLLSSWIPALDGVEERLRAGAKVADVGCGHGASTLLIAESYPESDVIGFDYHGPSIEQARKRASEAGLGTRVSFEVASAAGFPGTGYDLVAIFDALHDMPDPLGAAKHIRAALRPDGTFLLVEPFANDRLEDNLNPVGRLYYGASTTVCVAHSMTAEPRTALGAQAGEARLTELLREAGFTRVRRATETPFNIILEARP
ncbi:class I SAM-dependent methyltransferase [Kribbella turkmenica]|uniref:class I SAM-dependent methyltransferase n=1 Tax=Kribbella turkmenica TaxID=2530375 RepID=UPI00192DE740|nr:class I SAM-dependent methyltransferase [Kribbella turkmenica]